MTQDSFPSKSRKPTARDSFGRSPHNERTLIRPSALRFTVRTRNIAARVSGATTGCGKTREGLFAAAAVIEPLSGITMANRR